MTGPGFYFGTIRHRRHRPRAHEFEYPLFMALVDVDRIPELTAVSRLISHNRFNWATFDDRDHLDDGDLSAPLRRRIEKDAVRNGLPLPRGPVLLLTHLRYLGYAFNPVSFFYCFDDEGSLELVLAEVRNTFGERENYWLTPENEISDVNPRRWAAGKRMHVSPFMPMDLRYTFVLSDPGESLFIHMNTMDDEGVSFDATLRLQREPWSAASLRTALVRHPWMSAKVIGAIHWEALKLWIKGLPVFPHPAGARWKV